jgi:hypothetical protein
MDPTVLARELRRRGRALLQFANALDRAGLRDLRRLGGDATWYGPTAGAFLDDAALVERLVVDGVTALRRAAHRLEVEALDLERQAAAAAAPIGGAAATPAAAAGATVASRR